MAVGFLLEASSSFFSLSSPVVYEDSKCLAFKDLNPQAPTHLLVIPKERIALLQDATEADSAILGHLMLAAAKAAKIAKLESGYRVIVNNGYDGLQSVGHLHLHGMYIVCIQVDLWHKTVYENRN